MAHTPTPRHEPVPAPTRWKPATLGAVAGASLATAGVIGSASLASYFARRIVVPPKTPAEDVRVHSLGYSTVNVTDDDMPTNITLDATARTQATGNYGFFYTGGTGFAVLGEVLSYSPQNSTVTRAITEIVRGDIRTIDRGRISGVVALDPTQAGYAHEDIVLNLPVGEAPAWVIHPDAALTDRGTRKNKNPQPSTTWAIMVHGMGSTRAETLRALTTTQALGLTSLHMSYRNDREAPASEDGRYGLGFTEWRDVEVAIDYALTHGAQDVVLFGWSMGGSISLQTADKARNRHAIRALVLDGPAVDWPALLQYHGQLNRVPTRIGQLGLAMITHPALTSFTGLKEPIRLDQISWPHRAGDIRVPVLILHSVDDRFVPYEPSEELAKKSALVDLVPFTGASHTREWNTDPHKWNTTVTDWLTSTLRLN